MKALAVTPGKAQSARLLDIAEPYGSVGSLLVEMLAVGVCGTDHEILSGAYGSAPPGENFLVLGHESLGRVLEAPANSGFNRGDLVVGIVRRPDPVPCASCAHGEWDMCENGLYTERGIKQRHGYCSERFRLEPEYAIRVDAALAECGVLLEPTSVVAKAWDQIEKISRRSYFKARSVLVTGAGPIGLLAALLGRQRGCEVHVMDIVQSGPKPDLVRALGAHYLEAADLPKLKCKFDIAIECTGNGSVVLDVIGFSGPNTIVCLAGLSSGGRKISIDAWSLNRELVLENTLVFGSVNANRTHYEAAAKSLAQADRQWLARMITDRVPVSRWQEAFERKPAGVKTILVSDEGRAWRS